MNLIDLALWIMTALLVAAFGASAVVKGTRPKERVLQLGMTGVVDIPVPLMRFIAACEMCGIIGLVVPHLTGIAPILTSLAAIGLGIIMLLAARIHLRLDERRTAGGNLILLLICVLVAFGR